MPPTVYNFLVRTPDGVRVVDTPVPVCAHCGMSRSFHGTCDTCPRIVLQDGRFIGPSEQTWWNEAVDLMLPEHKVYRSRLEALTEDTLTETEARELERRLMSEQPEHKV